MNDELDKTPETPEEDNDKKKETPEETPEIDDVLSIEEEEGAEKPFDIDIPGLEDLESIDLESEETPEKKNEPELPPEPALTEPDSGEEEALSLDDASDELNPPDDIEVAGAENAVDEILSKEPESFNLDDFSLDDFDDISIEDESVSGLEKIDLDSFSLDDSDKDTAGDPDLELSEEAEPGMTSGKNSYEIEGIPEDTNPADIPGAEVSEDAFTLDDESAVPAPAEVSGTPPAAEEEVSGEEKKQEDGLAATPPPVKKKKSRAPVLLLLLIAAGASYYYLFELKPSVPPPAVMTEAPSPPRPVHPLAYAGALNLKEEKSDGVTALTYRVRAPLDDVRKHYKQKLIEEGYSLKTEELNTEAKYAYMVLSSSKRSVHIMLREDEGRVSAYLSYLD